jgi:hypothetical protein
MTDNKGNKAIKLEHVFSEAFDLYSRAESRVNSSEAKEIGFEERFKLDATGTKYWAVNVKNISHKYLGEILASQFSSREEAYKSGIGIMLSHTLKQCREQLLIPADQQEWMSKPPSYWYTLVSDIEKFCKRYEIPVSI